MMLCFLVYEMMTVLLDNGLLSLVKCFVFCHVMQLHLTQSLPYTRYSNKKSKTFDEPFYSLCHDAKLIENIPKSRRRSHEGRNSDEEWFSTENTITKALKPARSSKETTSFNFHLTYQVCMTQRPFTTWDVDVYKSQTRDNCLIT